MGYPALSNAAALRPPAAAPTHLKQTCREHTVARDPHRDEVCPRLLGNEECPHLVVGELDDLVALARKFRIDVRTVVGAQQHDAVIGLHALA